MSSANTEATSKTDMATLAAAPRAGVGKSIARRLRAENRIPAIAYGKQLAAMPISVAPKEIVAILKSAHGQNSVVQLNVDGGKNLLVMIKEYSYHPVKRTLEHVDFVEVKLDQPVDVSVPLVVKGKAEGVTLGGTLRQVFRTLPVRCLPQHIPLHIDVDVTPLKLNEHIATQDLKLPEGVTVRLPAEQTLVSIVAPEKDRAAEEAAAAPGAAPAAKTAAKTPAAKEAKKK